jgi:S1-C subfamily serine protease
MRLVSCGAVESGDLFDDDSSFRAPPSPDDRLWRHPSEIGWAPAPPKRHRASAVLVLASGVAGAALTVGALALTGTIGSHTSSRQVVEREAVRPVVATRLATDDDAKRLANGAAPSIVLLRVSARGRALGAGVVFRDDGHVLTNAHVVAATTTLVATLADGRTLTAKVIGTDTDTDLAVVKLIGSGPFVPAVLGTSDGMAVGDIAVATGARVSAGVISALGRQIAAGPDRTLDDLIQIDAQIDPPSSGGALLDAKGSVIGITTAYAGTSQVGFATPVDVARAIADDLLAVGHVRLVWLGVKGTEAPDGGGVVIADVIVDGPAAQAGLTAGDVVRRIDGHPIASMSQLRVALRRKHPGDPVRVVFDRNGRRHEAPVVVGERPATE